jgi:hypothetical protein
MDREVFRIEAVKRSEHQGVGDRPFPDEAGNLTEGFHKHFDILLFVL